MSTIETSRARRPDAARGRGRARRPASEPAIAVAHLTKHFRDTTAVDDLSFSVPTGTVTGFLGPNGAGKTTTIRAILGLARPDAGQVKVFGRPYGDIEQPLARVGALIDGSAFHPRRTAKAHLSAVAAAGSIAKARVDEVLESVELRTAAERHVGGFSLGMKQRLGLATALLGDPDLLILDEPANGLDPAGIRWLRGFLRAFAAAGNTVFVSSHVLAEVAEMADDVVVIRNGRLVTQTTVNRLTQPSSVSVRTPQSERLVAAIARAGGVVETDDGALEVTGLSAEEIGDLAASRKVVLHELTPRRHSLEDVFLELTEGDR